MNNYYPNEPSLSARGVAIAGHEGDAATVLAGLGHREPTIRVAAVSALVRMQIETADQMRLLLRDPEVPVRRAAANICQRCRVAGELVEDLVALLDDDETVAEVSAFALGEIGDTSRLVIEKLETMAVSHGDALCREAAVAALGSLGVGLQTILAALTDVATVRRRAVIALAPFDGPEVEAALAHALEDRDWQVRQAAEDLSLGDELGL